MKKWKWTGLAAGLMLVAMTVLPVGKVMAAGSNPGILPGGEGLAGKGVSHVYYGAHGGEPIETRVLSKEGKNLVVLSEYILEGVVFDNETNRQPMNSVWEGSLAQQWCKDLYANGFTAEEQKAIIKTVKEETVDTSGAWHGPCSLRGDYLYFLSANEATNSGYGFSSEPFDDPARAAMDKNGNRSEWWLRSPYSNFTVGPVGYNGYMTYQLAAVHVTLGGRPAFSINLNAVLFASAAVGGKTGTVGTFTETGTNDTKDWKLTVIDENRHFAIGNKEGKTVKTGGTVTLDYTGAKAGAKEYVSAMVVDGNGQAAYYGRMKAVTDASGQVEIGIPAGLAVGEYTLQVFNEQYNGDKKTDYASVPIEIPVTVVDQANVQPPVEDSAIAGVPVNATQGEQITFTAVGAGMDNGSPVGGDVRWKPISWQVNPSGDFADGNYTKSFDTSGMTPGVHVLTITYAKERYDGSGWLDTGERRTQEFAFTLAAAPSQGGGEQPATPPAAPGEASAATPGDLTGDNPGTGDGIRIGWLMAAGAGALFAAAALIRERKKA